MMVLVCVLDMGFGGVANLVLRMVQGGVQVGGVQQALLTREDGLVLVFCCDEQALLHSLTCH